MVQTSGGIGKAANTIIELIQKHTASVGCANPDGLTLRFLAEQACIQAKCNAIMVDQVRRACRGLKPNAVRHDDDWLPADLARAALRPYGRYGRPVSTPPQAFPRSNSSNTNNDNTSTTSQFSPAA